MPREGLACPVIRLGRQGLAFSLQEVKELHQEVELLLGRNNVKIGHVDEERLLMATK